MNRWSIRGTLLGAMVVLVGLLAVVSCGTGGATGADDAGATGHELLLVPAGPFLMGSDSGAAANQPAHTVHLDSFYIDRFEVTERQYRGCYDSGVCPPAVDAWVSSACTWLTPGEEDHPINCVTWQAASNLLRVGRPAPADGGGVGESGALR